MGLLDRFRSKKEQIGKDKKPKHVVAKSAKEKAEEDKRKRFAAVPGAGAEAKIKSPPAPHQEGAGRAGEAPRPESKKQAAAHKSGAKRKEDSGDAYKILLRPLVSEKSTSLMSTNQYVFVVAENANKITIRKAVQSLYGVRPQKVNIMNISGKFVRYGKTQGMTKHWKKAMVTLQPGEKLDVYGG